MKPSFLIAGIGLALAIIFGLQYLLKRDPPAAPEPVATQAITSPPAEPIAATPVIAVEDAELDPGPPLPALDASDAYVRELLAPQALPAAWFEPEQLLRRVATLLDNSAAGTFPKGQLGFLAPKGNFSVIPVGRRFRVNPQSYARFDGLVAALESVEVQTLAGVYRRLEPLLVIALAELGQAQSPDALLAQAIAVVAETPQLTDEVLLVRPTLLYKYHDPALEKLNPLHKQLLRMGPNNVARIQGYLVELAEVLALEVPNQN